MAKLKNLIFVCHPSQYAMLSERIKPANEVATAGVLSLRVGMELRQDPMVPLTITTSEGKVERVLGYFLDGTLDSHGLPSPDFIICKTKEEYIGNK